MFYAFIMNDSNQIYDGDVFLGQGDPSTSSTKLDSGRRSQFLIAEIPMKIPSFDLLGMFELISLLGKPKIIKCFG